MENLTVKECAAAKKPWYTSKVLWVNTLAGIGLILQAIAGTDILPPETQGVILAAANIFLRVITTAGIAIK